VFAYTAPFLFGASAISIACAATDGVHTLRLVWPALAIGLVTGSVGAALRLHPFRPEWLAPRRRQVLRQLELALAQWHVAAGDPNREHVTLERLRAALRATGGKPPAEQIVTVVKNLERSAEVGPSEVARDLRECIAMQPRSTQRRRPYKSSFSLSPSLPVFGIVVLPALYVIAHRFQALGSHALPDVCRVLAWSFLVFSLLWLAVKIELKRRVHIACSNFRTLFVSDRSPLEPINYYATKAYSKVGQLIAIFVSDEPAEGIEAALPGAGGELYFLPASVVSGVVEAFVDHSDLVVVHVEDQATSAYLLASTALAPEQRLALSTDGSTPTGFRWLDPLRLRLGPLHYTVHADEPFDAATAPNMGMSFEGWGSGDWVFGVAFILGLVLVGLPGCRLLGVLLVLSAYGGELPRFLGPLRRASVAQSTLRTPKSLLLSKRLLDAKRLERRLFWVLLAITLLASVLAARTVFPDWDGRLLVLLGAIFCASFFIVYSGLLDGLLRGAKWYLDWNFRIAVFRRNSVSFGYEHKFTVMASCGAYGQVLVVDDESLGRTDDNYGEWREEFEGPWLKIFSEMDDMLRPARFLQSWQDQVTAQLARADFAVFDWAQEITDNMKWELKAAVRCLPPSRILLVISDQYQSELNDFLASLDMRERGSIRPLVLSRERDDQYHWPSNRAFKSGFRQALIEMMSDLRVEPRITTSDSDQASSASRTAGC